jgi:hypothetical protein
MVISTITPCKIITKQYDNMITINTKGLYIDPNGSSGGLGSKFVAKFTAIVPVWANKKKKPINHIRLTGVAFSFYDYDLLDSCYWHPDNPFCEEKWIEIRIYQLIWEKGIANKFSRKELHSPFQFFAPAKQIQSIYKPTYRSKDREQEELKAGVSFMTTYQFHSGSTVKMPELKT